MIRFQDGEPVGIYYSQHRDGAAYDWDDESISKTDDRVHSGLSLPPPHTCHLSNSAYSPSRIALAGPTQRIRRKGKLCPDANQNPY